jgi:phospholipase C
MTPRTPSPRKSTLATAPASRSADGRIEHVFVLMMENRSFDHFLGDIPGVNGVDENARRRNRERPNSPREYQQEPDAVRKLKPDPHHDAKNVLRQVEGEGLGAMGGFVFDFALEEPKSQPAWHQVMSYFPKGSLPALHELASAFCVCDAWFSSVPGPTWPNRFFVHSGTSQGWINMPVPPLHMNLHKYDQVTIYDRLNERGVSWRIYAGDIPQSLLLYNQRNKENRKHYSAMGHFYKDVANTDGGGFPAYVFIEPSYLPNGQNDQHPPHDVLKGDDLIASVYNAIRANEKLWNTSLLILTWDEHGGFYDHEHPPPAVPPDHKHQEGFEFNQYGVRVPTVLISKWVRPASVFRTSAAVLDHTSILRYLSDEYGLGPLGNRTAAAASFADAIVKTANNRAPARVGMAPRPSAFSVVEESAPSLNKNQLALIDFTKQLEIESGAAPADIGSRAMRAATGVDGEVEAAKERVRIFLSQADR